jgi:hypothetical protein
MFVCRDCNAKDKSCNIIHVFFSFGRCEICYARAGCADCKCYKREAKPPDVQIGKKK